LIPGLPDTERSARMSFRRPASATTKYGRCEDLGPLRMCEESLKPLAAYLKTPVQSHGCAYDSPVTLFGYALRLFGGVAPFAIPLFCVSIWSVQCRRYRRWLSNGGVAVDAVLPVPMRGVIYSSATSLQSLAKGIGAGSYTISQGLVGLGWGGAAFLLQRRVSIVHSKHIDD